MTTTIAHVQAQADVLDELGNEVVRQDRTHPAGYPSDRDGVFRGITTAAGELVEALQAWHVEKRVGQWDTTRGELLQAAAVIVRTIRSIDMSERPEAERLRALIRKLDDSGLDDLTLDEAVLYKQVVRG